MAKTQAKHGKHAKGNIEKTSAVEKGDLKEESADLVVSGGDAQEAESATFDSVEAEETIQFADPYATKEFVPANAAEIPDLAGDASFGSFTPANVGSTNQTYAYAGNGFGNSELKTEKRSGKKIAAIIIGSIFGVLLAAYLIGIGVFSNWYFPGTNIGSIDASMKTTAEIEQELGSAVDNYKVDVSGGGFNYTVDATKAGVTVDSAAIASEMHNALPAWQWPYLITQQTHDLTDLFSTSYAGASTLNDSIKSAVDKFNETATQPVDATIEYNADKDQFQIKSEEYGTAIDANAVIKKVDDAILSFNETVLLTKSELVQPKVLSTDERLKSAAEAATRMCNVEIKLTMAGHDAGTINADNVSQWITLGDDYTVHLNEDALTAYVNQLESSLDTVGTERTYTRSDGKVISVSGGVFGWEVDSESLHSAINDAVKSGQSQTIDIPTVSEGDAYNGAGQRDWGNRYIDVDLAEQHVRMYDDSGNIIWESDCISGEPDGVHDTPTGVFWLNAKASPSKLIGYENGVKIYESEVRYWMPFDGNAIGLHDADWQPGFGGSMYAQGYGSHGCVNLPVGAAAELYQITYSGDCVVVHY